MSKLKIEEEVQRIKNELFAFKLDTAIMVEGKDDESVEEQSDKAFWSRIFKTCQPDLKYKVYKESSYSTGTGKKAVLEFTEFAAKDFILCVDSDYDYIIGEESVDDNPYILQTYAYSFENYICNPQLLESVCCKGAGVESIDFDFEEFYSDFSTIIYPLFLVSLNEELKNAHTPAFTRSNMGELIKFERVNKPDNESISHYLEVLREKVENILEQFPLFDEEQTQIETKLSKFGESFTDKIYWLTRGKDIYAVTEKLLELVIHLYINREREKIKEELDGDLIAKAMRDYDNLREQWKPILLTEFEVTNTPFFPKIQTDIQHIFQQPT